MASNKGNNRKRRADKQKARDQRRASSRTEFVLNPVLEQAFMDWLPDSEFADELTPEQAVEGVAPVLGMIAHGNPRFSATAWTMADLDVFAAFLDDVEANGTELDLQVSDGLQLAAMAWLHFLEKTDRWTGTDENLVYCTGVLGVDQLDAPTVRTPSMIELEPVDPDVEREALAALPATSRLRSVLEWIGDGVSVTDSGALTVADTNALGQVLGFPEPAPLESMYDFSGVSIPWTVLTGVGLVDIDGERATPTDRVAQWAGGDLQLLRATVAAYLGAELDDFTSTDITMDAGFVVVQLLLGGLDDDPMAPIDPVDEFDDEQMSLARTFTTGLTDRFIEDGYLVSVDGLLEVPAPLRPAVLLGVPEVTADDDLDEFDDL